MLNIFCNFFFCVKIQYDFFYFLIDLAICMKTKTHFFVFLYNVFATFQKKNPGILISDLYLYSIKIQIDINPK
jgi:hypothetical protein